MKISKEILDNIVEQLCEGREWDNVSTAHYDENDIYIDASVRWIVESYDNYIDGYLEGIYDEVTGWDDLKVEAWVGDDPAEVDKSYIIKKLGF